MSSIIKTGCAPSNTPDGKYFLQTDQACFAELKRGRTYIMTAQEEAKVSHYVIITNADFTVTFNGDSDLVQVGRANNAIVMNVHRACRIDFVQGGNLEFKEGTAEFSSRIEMGVNTSGNVLVASTLPQQGDFAGQICSLTTGATYVWTGSEWSSTAGSSTLPTPTSSNNNFILASNGSSWVATQKKMFFGQGEAGTDWYHIYYYKKIASHSTEALHRSGQLSVDYTMGCHTRASFNGKMKMTFTSNAEGRVTHGVSILEYPAYVLYNSVVQPTPEYMSSKWWTTDIGVTLNTETGKLDVYLVLYGLQASLMYQPRVTLDNIIGDEDWTYNNTIAWDGCSTTLPSTIALGYKSVWQVPPAPTTADNGKVLKVVDGVPTWTSA